MAGLGDIFCQKVIENKKWSEYSAQRTLTQASFAMFFMAPAAHAWFSKILPICLSHLKNKSSRIAASVFFDNTVFMAGMLGSSIFIFSLFKTQNIPASLKRIQVKFTRMYESAVRYWTTVSVFTHVLLPIRYKAIASNMGGVVWKVYMSYLMNAPDEIPAIVGK